VVTIPTIVIAAPASGSGKTTVTTGLIGALRAAGHRVAPFKVGPDFIDPGYHAVAAGRPGRNLDPNLVGTDLVPRLFAAGSAGADIAVVEGVMGLFDGRIRSDDSGSAVADADPVAYGSTAHVAALIGAPVVLVVDGSGHSQSLAALLHGFLTYDSSVRIAGVILNRVGSPRHEQVLRHACARVGLPVFGVIGRDPSLMVPSRHLGLIPAAERSTEAVAAVAAMSTEMTVSLDIPAIVDAAATRARLTATPWSATDALEPAGSPVIAVAGGPAFTFCYTELGELLTAAGARIAVFDPVTDPLPDGTAGVVIGGGFPEEHAAELSANITLRQQLSEHAKSGGPIWAECAGLLYLTRELDGHPMAGVLDAVGRFSPALTLGYRDAISVADSVLFREGERVTGHEFHRSVVVEDRPGRSPAWMWRDSSGRPARHGHVTGGVHASYLHLHPAAHPAAVAGFVAAADVFQHTAPDHTRRAMTEPT
jgi:cobyrinic acid a,c-diamide synthase